MKRRGWDSNPRALADKRFSRPPRYDHFDTPAWERVMGIEPTYPAWKAGVLPLNYTRKIYYKSGWQDSNLRPPGPKPGALAKLSHTPLSLFASLKDKYKYIQFTHFCQAILLFFSLILLFFLIFSIFHTLCTFIHRYLPQKISTFSSHLHIKESPKTQGFRGCYFSLS